MALFYLHFLVILLFAMPPSLFAQIPAYQNEMAQKWTTQEFQPSTLNHSEQMQEMNWFIKA